MESFQQHKKLNVGYQLGHMEVLFTSGAREDCAVKLQFWAVYSFH